jgi:hypothetical protein
MTISDLFYVGLKGIFSFDSPYPQLSMPSNILSTSSVDEESITVGPLLTVSRIQTIGELLANSIDIQKEYFSNTGQTSSDYENFLKVNGKIITFTDSLGTIYKIPTTYINWPPYQNGYPYQIMGANIAIGPFEATADLTSEVSYLSCVIESITGITPNLTLVELSDVYLVDKYSSNIIESVRYNNINAPGTFMYYKNMSETIQNDISAIAGVLGLSETIQYGLVNELGCF